MPPDADLQLQAINNGHVILHCTFKMAFFILRLGSGRAPKSCAPE